MLIIAQFGSNTGFVDEVLGVSNKKSGNQHEKMKAQVFEEWFFKIILKLEENGIVAMYPFSKT